MRCSVAGVLLTLTTVPLAAQEEDAAAARRKPMVDEAAKILAEQDTFAAIQFIEDRDGPADIINVYQDLTMRLYWDEKNLPACLAMGRAGIQYGLTTAPGVEETNAKLASGLRSVAKALAYNVASFTWPGWDEPGIEPTRSDVLIGLDAAKANLRLAQDLEKPGIAHSRAYWMLAAVRVAFGDYAPAEAEFVKATDYARQAGEEVEALNCAAWVRLAAHLADPEDAGKRDAVAAAKKALADGGDDGFFGGQIETAERVFAPDR